LEYAHGLHESACGSLLDWVMTWYCLLLAIAIGALLTNLCIKNAVARPRPYWDETSIFHQWWVEVGARIENDFSFPSGHSTQAFSAMTAVFLVGNKKYSWFSYVFAILMGMFEYI
jgi:undecaprenyl-diphosphatase